MVKNACHETVFFINTKDFVMAELMLKMMTVQDAQPHQNVDRRLDIFILTFFFLDVVGRPERSSSSTISLTFTKSFSLKLAR